MSIGILQTNVTCGEALLSCVPFVGVAYGVLSSRDDWLCCRENRINSLEMPVFKSTMEEEYSRVAELYAKKLIEAESLRAEVNGILLQKTRGEVPAEGTEERLHWDAKEHIKKLDFTLISREVERSIKELVRLGKLQEREVAEFNSKIRAYKENINIYPRSRVLLSICALTSSLLTLIGLIVGIALSIFTGVVTVAALAITFASILFHACLIDKYRHRSISTD